jgi:hypothetical protein
MTGTFISPLLDRVGVFLGILLIIFVTDPIAAYGEQIRMGL